MPVLRVLALLAFLAAAGCKQDEPAPAAESKPAPAPTPATGTLAVRGVLTGEGVECQAFRDMSGVLYTLTGELAGFATGDTVCVKGRRAEMSTCQQGITIIVDRIGPREECP